MDSGSVSGICGRCSHIQKIKLNAESWVCEMCYAENKIYFKRNGIVGVTGIVYE